MIREFYANVARSEEQMEGLDRHPYTSYVRGVEIDFSPANIRRVMRFKEDIPGAENNYDNRQNNDQQLDAVLRDLCIPGASWKMEGGKSSSSTNVPHYEPENEAENENFVEQEQKQHPYFEQQHPHFDHQQQQNFDQQPQYVTYADFQQFQQNYMEQN
ncbi:hypothetical protein PIB30_054670 [Stylosanthes scabra]|uniref:Putative plant transposon protein domain-containing protein n=1 Tax=Stylosanthes scabra TaxID=79078 RepID=A0ABU6RJS0_9FABA|nr:hypothetical protein [Stylosanthes scabra]